MLEILFFLGLQELVLIVLYKVDYVSSSGCNREYCHTSSLVMLFFVLYLLFVFWLVWPLRWSYHLWHVRFPIYLHLSMLDSVIVHLWSCKDILRIKQVVWNGAVFLMRSSYLVGKLASLQQCRKLVEFFLGWLYVYIYIWFD